jgi:uncharacterized protein YndB with AHSA1/START domain
MTDTEFVYVTYIASTADKVWQAITDADISGRYWGNSNVSDWKAGSPWKHVSEAKETRIAGEVVEAVPPKRLVVTWAAPDKVGNQTATSRVTFVLEPMVDMVKLIVTHDRLQAGSDMARDINNGWPLVLASLKSYLETGRPLNLRARTKAA